MRPLSFLCELSEKNMNLFKKKVEPEVEIENPDVSEEKYDGFYFVPDYEDFEYNMKLAFFSFKDEMKDAKPIESSEMGDKYHLAFFTSDEEGAPSFEDSFEAILADPVVYIKNMVGTGMSGCILRKTEKSDEWWTDYLDYVTGGVFKEKVKAAFSNLAE
jgi:hypothetical protein